MLPRPMIGILLASAAGVFWGSMSIASQYLMEAVSFDAIDLASLRLAGAGVLLLALEALVLREDVLAPFRDRKDRRDIVFYALGMLGIQLTFFLSIRDANAATAALTVTTGPLFVTGWTAYSERRAITLDEWISIVLAIGGGAILCLINPPDVAAVEWNLVTTGLYFYIAAVGTVAAFWCYLKSLAYISAPTTALLANFEPLTAVVLGVLLLGLTLNAAELVGIALLAVMVFRLTRAKKN